MQQGVSAIHLTPKALQTYSKAKMNGTVLDHPPPTLLDYWFDTDSELLWLVMSMNCHQHWRIQGVPTPREGGANLLFGKILPKKAWNWQKLDQEGARILSALLNRPMLLFQFFSISSTYRRNCQKNSLTPSSGISSIYHWLGVTGLHTFISLAANIIRLRQMKQVKGCFMWYIPILFVLHLLRQKRKNNLQILQIIKVNVNLRLSHLFLLAVS